ncbi:hypothetical protein OH77DRAFT_1415492 [Trametes cingulata]|nr:hypothetical protein OH77DRAFT_1415492 [Trametes cingulata]
MPVDRVFVSSNHPASEDCTDNAILGSAVSYEDVPVRQRRRIHRDYDEESNSGEHPAGAPVQGFRKAQRIAEPTDGRRVRPRRGDYEKEAQEVLDLAFIIYKSMVMSRDGYPDKLTEKTWATDAWQQAAARLDVHLAPNSEVLQIITQYSWNLRGELKTYARGCVPGAYGFKAGITTAAQAFNRERAAKILHERTFTYETISEDSQGHVGLYENEIIQDIINRGFYKSADDDGIALADIYDPFPAAGIALVLTAVQCAIEEWATGAHTSVKFSEEKKYSRAYKGHLNDLREFETASGDDRIVSEICERISRHGRLCAKAPISNQHDGTSLPRSAISQAVADYRRRKEEALRGAGAQ